ncbi:hypothetical protein TWF696_000846 [Orbilia brochopaga]|uniref:Small RNA 2'-O-methyltransferase n=1 Tax=Orbilia brochopaga TaxID=3140254 RepID=A0AAV9VEV1_9PEZI
MHEDSASNKEEPHGGSAPAPTSGAQIHLPIPSEVPKPPYTPPCIKFEPALSIQRRVKVHDLLKEVSRDYSSPIQSLLEVGCGGNTPLMQSLLRCDDELPLSILSGIDIDQQLFSDGIKTAFTPRGDDEEDRWRDLTVSLIHGSFEHINLQNIGPFDAITSCEVIEHLDPEPLANFAPVLLGRMNPKVLIVTTPNRDFNSLFEMPFESLDVVDGEKPYVWNPRDDPNVAGRRFYRAPHTYAMRHDDHRFEWTRAEFQEWGNAAAEQFNYTVEYHGCGALRDGAEIIAARWRVEEALRRQLRSLNIKVDEQEQQISTEVLSQAFGHCSQVAIFIRNDFNKKTDDMKTSLEEQLFTKELPNMTPIVAYHIRNLQQLSKPLQRVRCHTFKREPAETYPPKLRDLFVAQYLTLKLMLPVEIQRLWQMGDPREEYKDYEYDVVVMHTDLQTLWDCCASVRRACRHHLEVFEYLMATADDAEFQAPEPAAKKAPQVTLVTMGLPPVDGVAAPGKKAVLTMDLQPVEIYVAAYQRMKFHFDDSDEGEPEDGKRRQRKTEPIPESSMISYSPAIIVDVIWHQPTEYPATAAEPQRTLDIPAGLEDGKLLFLRRPVDTMAKYKASEHTRTVGNGQDRTGGEEGGLSTPLQLIFYRPERKQEHEDIFDYEGQRKKILADFPQAQWESDGSDAESASQKWNSW